MAQPTFLSWGSTPHRSDTLNTLLKRIAGGIANNATQGGGAAGAGYVYSYSGSPPPAFLPTDVNSAAFAYAADGQGPTFTWSVANQVWQ